MIGPKLQSDPWVILTRWRQYLYVFTADIVKMFRQIKVHPDDAVWQQILWRSDPSQQMLILALITATYGTDCAPYLALRTLLQLAGDEEEKYPLGARAIRKSSYVDDFFVGDDTLESAMNAKDQLIAILKAGGFELSKWGSNNPELCPDTNSEVKQLPNDLITTLGLVWNPQSDVFSLKISMSDFQKCQPTKRSVLSDIARLFYPLGWYSPVLITAKILIQDMWLLGLDWDQPLSSRLLELWESFKVKLPKLETITVARWLGTTSNSMVEIHVFTDASERAYSATVYLRTVMTCTGTTANLLLAKTKVAPVKTLSIPRLELCGALLGAKLVDQVRRKLGFENAPTYAWVDSQVTLSWIKAHASKWTPFVANRVSKIQSILPPNAWYHVRTHESPADLATRGIAPDELKASSLWWNGPVWLSDPDFILGNSETIEPTSLELKRRDF